MHHALHVMDTPAHRKWLKEVFWHFRNACQPRQIANGYGKCLAPVAR